MELNVIKKLNKKSTPLHDLLLSTTKYKYSDSKGKDTSYQVFKTKLNKIVSSTSDDKLREYNKGINMHVNSNTKKITPLEILDLKNIDNDIFTYYVSNMKIHIQPVTFKRLSNSKRVIVDKILKKQKDKNKLINYIQNKNIKNCNKNILKFYKKYTSDNHNTLLHKLLNKDKTINTKYIDTPELYQLCKEIELLLNK